MGLCQADIPIGTEELIIYTVLFAPHHERFLQAQPVVCKVLRFGYNHDFPFVALRAAADMHPGRLPGLTIFVNHLVDVRFVDKKACRCKQIEIGVGMTLRQSPDFFQDFRPYFFIGLDSFLESARTDAGVRTISQSGRINSWR